jgi:hypothetical protein
MADKKVSFELFLISFLVLFLDLAIIRWLSTEVRIFAHFWFPILCVCLILVITLAPVIGITHVIFVDPRQYFLLGATMGDHAVNSAPSLFQTIKALSVMVGLYFLVMAVFATLCTKLGELLNRTKPLTGYSINVAGSLCGVATFSLVSFLRWPPGFWLILVFALLIYFHLGRRWVCGYFLIAVGTTTLTGITYPAQWSPYYKKSWCRRTGRSAYRFFIFW